jgi:hypothetical protein
MRVTREMIEAARRAEYDYYQKGRKIGSERFVATPDAVIRAMLEAALGTAPVPQQEGGKTPSIVTARKPRPR